MEDKDGDNEETRHREQKGGRQIERQGEIHTDRANKDRDNEKDRDTHTHRNGRRQREGNRDRQTETRREGETEG